MRRAIIRRNIKSMHGALEKENEISAQSYKH